MGNTTCCRVNDRLAFDTEITVPPEPKPKPKSRSSASSTFLKQFMVGHPEINTVLTSQPMFKEYNKHFNRQQLITRTEPHKLPDGTFIGDSNFGILVTDRGQYYQGEMKDGVKNGKGILIGKQGEYYCGEWKNGVPHGFGTYHYINPRAMYKGHWQQGLKSGYGEEDCADGSKYVGNYVSGEKDGQGKIVYLDRTSYEGQFVGGVPEGMGVFRGKDNIYDGSWKNGKMHGAGTCKWYDKNQQVISKYFGQYREGIKQGYGQYTDQKGITYKGMWLNGQLNESAPIDILGSSKIF